MEINKESRGKGSKSVKFTLDLEKACPEDFTNDRISPASSSNSNSPFHSAAEDQEGPLLHENDRTTLLFKGGRGQGGMFHNFLQGKRKKGKPFSNPPRDQQAHQQLPFPSQPQPQYFSDSDSEGEEDQKGSPSHAHNNGRNKCSVGILLAAISCIFFATSALIVKVSALHPMELLFARGLLQAIFIAPLVISSGNSFLGPPGVRALLLARAVLGAVSLIMSFAAIHLIPLADAATVIFTSPIFVSLFACICLGEICSFFDVVMILLTLIGVMLVSQPSFSFLTVGSWSSVLGTVCGLLAAMLTALAFIVLRQLKAVHYSVTVFWFSTILALFGGVLMVALDGFRMPENWTEGLDCFGIGVCGFLGQVLLTKALQLERAGPCAVTRTLDIVLAFFYQITLLHDTPGLGSYIGSFLVVSCVLLTAFRRWYREKYGLDREVKEGGSRGYARAGSGDGEGRFK